MGKNMFNFLSAAFFGYNSNTSTKIRATKTRYGRQCRIEELEGREMLSATPFSLALDYPSDMQPDFVEIENTQALIPLGILPPKVTGKTNIAGDEIELQFNRVPGESYAVQLWNSEDDWESVWTSEDPVMVLPETVSFEDNIDTGTLTIKGLDPDQEYVFQVVARDETGSKNSQTITKEIKVIKEVDVTKNAVKAKLAVSKVVKPSLTTVTLTVTINPGNLKKAGYVGDSGKALEDFNASGVEYEIRYNNKPNVAAAPITVGADQFKADTNKNGKITGYTAEVTLANLQADAVKGVKLGKADISVKTASKSSMDTLNKKGSFGSVNIATAKYTDIGKIKLVKNGATADSVQLQFNAASLMRETDTMSFTISTGKKGTTASAIVTLIKGSLDIWTVYEILDGKGIDGKECLKLNLTNDDFVLTEEGSVFKKWDVGSIVDSKPLKEALYTMKIDGLTKNSKYSFAVQSSVSPPNYGFEVKTLSNKMAKGKAKTKKL